MLRACRPDGAWPAATRSGLCTPERRLYCSRARAPLVAKDPEGTTAEPGKAPECDTATESGKHRDGQQVEWPARPDQVQWAAHFELPGSVDSGRHVVFRGKILQCQCKGIHRCLVILQECHLHPSQPVWQTLRHLLSAITTRDNHAIYGRQVG